jgi:hypothetical protein
MILYCLNKEFCGWSERVALVEDSERITSCPECNSVALIYSKDQTDYIENPTEEQTIDIILTFGLVSPLPREKE